MTYIGQAQINMTTEADQDYKVGDLVVWRSAQLRDKTTRYLVEGFDGDRVVLRGLDKDTWSPIAEWFVRSHADVSQSADQDTAPMPADPDTVTRADKLRAVAQQAHDDGDCVCCMDDTDLVFTRNEIIPSDTITISREAAERFARYYDRCDDDCTAGPCEMHKIVSAALEGEK